MAAYPLIEAFLRRRQRGVGRINARGSAIGQALRPFAGNVSRYYGPIKSQESSLGTALNQQQVGTGQQLGGQIGSALQGIQAPGAAVQQFGAGTAQTGAAAGAAIGSLSSADLERLHSQSSAEAIYASALPRLAELAADQERRSFLADAQDELMELAAQESERAYGRQQDEREFRRQSQQDKIEIQRYQRDQRQRQRATRYDRNQDASERKRQRTLDRMAAQAAQAEYGMDIADYQQDERALQERGRSARERERIARQREQRQAAKDKAAAKGKGKAQGTVGADPLYDDLLRAANSYAGTQGAVLSKNRVNRATARTRLWAAYGTALVDKGYPNKSVKQAIERALNAAGY